MDGDRFVDPRTRSKRGRGRGRDRGRGKTRDRGRSRDGARSTPGNVEGPSDVHGTRNAIEELDSNWDRFKSFDTQRRQARRNGATIETTEENFIPKAVEFSDDSQFGHYKDDGVYEDEEDNADYSTSAHNRIDELGADAPSDSFLMGTDDSDTAAFASRKPLQAQFYEVSKVIAQAPLWARLGVHAQWSLQEEDKRLTDLLPAFKECDTNITSKTSADQNVDTSKIDADVEDMLRDVDALEIDDDSSDSTPQLDGQNGTSPNEKAIQADSDVNDALDDGFDKWLDEV